jgi:pilus assembly protein FimV
MGRLKRRSVLGQHIAEILGTDGPFGPTGQHSAASRSLLLGGMALITLNPSPAGAIGLGEINIESRLGEPLRATVPMSVAPGESLPANCITATSRQTGLRFPEKVRVTSPPVPGAGNYTIQVSTALPLHEPMYELSIAVACPDVPSFTHHYVLMIELPDLPVQTMTVDLQQAAPPVTAVVGNTKALAPAAPDPVPEQPPARKPAATPARLLTATREAIPAGTLYQVRNGDSLSRIAERVAGRPPGTIWRVSQRIFQNNEHAFIRNNSNMIKLGSVILIPDAAEMASIASPAAPAKAAAPTGESRPKPAPALPGLTQPGATTAQPASATPAPAPGIAAATLPAAAASGRSVPTVTAPTASSPDPAAVRSPTIQEPESAAVPSPTVQEPEPARANAGNNSISDSPEVIPVVQTPDASVSSPRRNAEISPWIAVGTGILLGFSLSLLLLRERLVKALADLFRRKPKTSAAPIWNMHKTKDAPASAQAQANALLPEANEFLDTIAEDAFQTNAQYADYTAVIPVGKPLEDTYIVEVENPAGEPTIREENGLSAVADTEVMEPDADASGGDIFADPGQSTDDGDAMSDDTMLAHLFDDGYHKASDVIDPTSDALAETSEAESIEPTVDIEVPIMESPIPDLPIYRQIDPIDPTVDMPRQSEVIDPTADMPIHALDPMTAATVDMPKEGLDDGSDDAPDHSSQIPMGAFGMDASLLSQSFSDDLESIDPDAMFQTSDKLDELDELDELDDSPTDKNLLAQVLAEVEEETVSRNFADDDDDTFSNTLGDALSLLEREYEDEFTASQVLEGTAIRKSLGESLGDSMDDQEDERPDLDDSDEHEKTGKSRAG